MSSVKKTGRKKLDKKIIDVFRKLNNRSTYKYIGETDSGTHQNLMDFCSLLVKACDKKYPDSGNGKKYSKEHVGWIIADLFPNPTEVQIETLDKLNKYIKKEKDIDLMMYPIKGLFPGKSYDRYLLELETDSI